MDKLILLCGKSNTGKTITLKMLAALLFPFDKNAKPPRKIKTVADFWKKIDEEMNVKKPASDFRTVMELHGKKIGIYSYGDDVNTIKDGIKYFQDNFCDIGVMPCHPDVKHFDILVPVCGEIMTVLPKRKCEDNPQERYFENITVATKLYLAVIDHF